MEEGGEVIKRNIMYELLDAACAEALGVDVEVYIEKIENTTDHRAMLIISALLSDNDKLIEKARRVFALID